ncbi:hypothetical protein ACTWLI_11990 [Arthrobacter sp. Hor0625]|uniref:hypothetical protein n=1 Tax=Arthrobacter sp. Hor0625 TaxID=3457358 RepID=UPI00403E4A00
MRRYDGGRPGSAGGFSRNRSFLFYALGSVATFAMAARAVHWLDGPLWVALVLLAAGLALALFYLARAVARARRPGNADLTGGPP